MRSGVRVLSDEPYVKKPARASTLGKVTPSGAANLARESTSATFHSKRLRISDKEQNSSNSYRLDVQGLRGIAVLLVVGYHAGLPLPGGFVGVDVFFVLSGYVITRTLLTELERSERIDFRRFYLRRVRRLLPALGLLLFTTLLLSILLVPIESQPITARTGAAAAIFNANTYLVRFGGGGGYFGLSSESNALLHTWSLSVEEQFYLLFPAMLAGTYVFAIRRKRNPLSAVGLLFGASAGASFVLSWLLTTRRLNPSGLGAQLAFYSAPTRAWEFAVGGVVALMANRQIQIKREWANGAWIAGLSMLAIAIFAFNRSTAFPGTAAVLPVFGTALLVAAGEPGSTLFTRILSFRPLTFIGDCSYSWYLWHWPFVVFAGGLFPTAPAAKAIAAGISFVPATLSYRWLEMPIRKRPARHRTTLALTLVAIVVPVTSAAALELGHRSLLRRDLLASFGNHPNCDTVTLPGWHGPPECRSLAPNSVGTGVLIGDSNAGHFAEAFFGATKALNLNGLDAARTSCPFSDITVVDRTGEGVRCHEFLVRAIAELVTMKPRLVVAASASDLYIERSDVVLKSPDGYLHRGAQAKADAYEAGLVRFTMALRQAGIPVVIVHPVPRLNRHWKPIRMAPLMLMGRQAWLNTSVDRDAARRQRARAVTTEIDAAKRSDSSTLDVFDELCTRQRCRARYGATWLFRDATHLSVAASNGLAGTFRLAIARVARNA